MVKWMLIAVGVLALMALGMLIYNAGPVNERVSAELHDDPQGARADRVMLLTFPDDTIIPVNYLREGNLVFAGSDGWWWRDFRDGNVPVTVLIRGETLTGRAHTVLDDPDYTRDVFTRLRPAVPKWLPDSLNAYLVVIELDDPT